MRRVIVFDAVPGMVLWAPVPTADGRELFAAGHVLTETDIAMLAREPGAEIEVEDALARYEGARPLFAPHVEATALQALNSLIMLHPGLEEPVRHQGLATLLAALDELVDGVIGDMVGTVDFAGPDSLQGRDYIHPIKVAELCVVIGRAMGMPKADLLSLAQASALMNLGYAALRRSLLDEPRGLEEHEWRHQVEMHPEYSARILASAGLSHEAVTAIEEHHERWDGSGYPRGLQGKAISRFARMIAIGDTYVSLRSRRAYRNPLSHKDALELLNDGADEFFDPELVCVFSDVAGRLMAPEPAAQPAGPSLADMADEREEQAATLRSKVAEEAAREAAPRRNELTLLHDDEAAQKASRRAAPQRPVTANTAATPRVSASRARPTAAAAITSVRRPVVGTAPQRRQRPGRRGPGSLWSAGLYLDAAAQGGWGAVRLRP